MVSSTADGGGVKRQPTSRVPEGNGVPGDWRPFDDETLLRAMSEGHAGAFDEFFARHSATMLAFLARLVAAKADPEDLLQETFLRVLTHADSFKPGLPIRPWLFTIARNAAFSSLRKSKLRGELEVQTDLSDWHMPTAGRGGNESNDPSEHVEREEEKARVLTALDDLPPLHREILVLTLFDGFSYEEASAITGDSEGTLRSRAFYALRKLRDRLKERS